MKKMIFAVAALVATMTAVTSCSTDEVNNEAPVLKSNTISLTSTFKTRATSDLQSTQLSTAVTVGAFGVASGATITNGDNNQYSVEANGDLTAATDMTWPVEGSVSICAYAPYQAGWAYNSDNAFSVATDQSTDAGYLASDLVYGVPSSNPVAQTEDAIALSFAHKLAKINITIQKATDATIDLTDASVTIVNTKVATTLNPSTGAIGEATGDAADIKAVTALGTATTACAIIVPQEIAANTQLVKIVAGDKTLIAKVGTATTFVGGKSYNFTVNVGSTPEPVTEVTLKLGSTSIVGWGAEDMGAATGEEPAVEPLYATFGTPANNATYEAPTYTWTGSTSNLMPVFEFANGELAKYTTLTFKFSNISADASVRIGYYVGSNWTQIGGSYYTAGTKAIDLTTLTVDLSTVTRISFGGSSGSGSVDILASDFVLTKE